MRRALQVAHPVFVFLLPSLLYFLRASSKCADAAARHAGSGSSGAMMRHRRAFKEVLEGQAIAEAKGERLIGSVRSEACGRHQK
jgi:hypothetical protein